MEHECDVREHRCDKLVPISYSGGEWWLCLRGGMEYPVAFCPGCGEKLGPPDVKIEVSRKVLIAWTEDLTAALGQNLIIRYGGVNWSVVRGVVRSIQGILND